MAMQKSQSGETDETSDLISSDKVDGTAVYNREGEKLGSIHTLMIDKTAGKVTYAVMSFGGFLGIGDRYHPLPWDVLTYDTGQGGYVVDLDRSMLEAAAHIRQQRDAELERSPLEPGCIRLLRRASLLGLGGAEARSAAGRGRSGDIVDTNQSPSPPP